MDYTIRLLSAVSCTEEIQGKGRNIVYLFGTTKDGESIAVRTPLQLPYFQVVEPPQNIIESLKQRDDVEKVEDQELWVDGAVKNCLKVTVPHPGKVPKIREWLKSNDLKLLAADIPFHHRYLYDNNIGGCVRVRGKKIIKDKWSCKVIEVVEILPAENFESNFKVLSFDIENSILERTIYCLSYCIKTSEGYVHEDTLYGDEKKLLTDFVKAVNEHDPDIITGYNIDGYDLPLLVERAELHGIDLAIGRNGSILEQRFQRFWQAKGRVIVDAWWNVKREVRPRQESLNAVAKELLGKEKHDVNPSKMDEEWANNSEKVMESKSMYVGLTKNFKINKNDEIYLNDSKSLLNKKHEPSLKKLILSDEIECYKGPEYSKLTTQNKQKLLSAQFSISNNHNRMGYVLDQKIKNTIKPIITSHVMPGTVQLTPGGDIIILMRDSQTTGGYPRILQLTNKGIDFVAQKRTGSLIKFSINN